MYFNTALPLDKENFLLKSKTLAERGAVVELIEKKQRTYNQNSYLHVILGYFALDKGLTPEYVKQIYFKEGVNPDIFIRKKQDKFLGEVKYLRSTADLTKEEMSICIDRFLNWSMLEAELYLPTPQDHAMIRQAEIEIERHKKEIYGYNRNYD